MRNLSKTIIVILALILGFNSIAQAGTTTTHGYFYKPGYGEKGPVAYSLYNAALDATDAFLFGAYGVPTALYDLINNWVIQDNIVTLVTATPTYVDGDTFTLPGDYLVRFATGAVVQVQVAAGIVHSTVASSSYTGGVTTVNLNNAVLTNPITRVYVVATRDGLWPNGPGYIVARDYGTTQANLATADGIAAAAGKQLVIGYAYSITSDLTLSSNFKVMPGVPFAIATTKTLTINKPLDAGLYQIFSCTGTGKVVFGAGSVKEVYPEWWGDTSTGDSAAKIQAAVNSVSNGEPIILMPGRTYTTTAAEITLVNKTHIIGYGATIHSENATSDAAIFWGGFTGGLITDVVIEGVYFTGYGPSHTAPYAIHWKGNRCKVINCRFYNMVYGVKEDSAGSEATVTTDTVIEGCTFDTCMMGILSSATGSVYKNNKFYNIGLTVYHHAIYLTTGANQITIEGNLVDGSAGAGLHVYSASNPSGIYDIKSIGNTYKNCCEGAVSGSTYGLIFNLVDTVPGLKSIGDTFVNCNIYVQAADVTLISPTISGTIADFSNPTQVYVDHPGCQIIGGNLSGVTYAGIYQAAGATNLQINGAKITGCTNTGVYSAADGMALVNCDISAPTIAVSIRSANGVYTGNRLSSPAGTGIQLYGGTPNNNYIQNNFITSQGATYNIIDAGAANQIQYYPALPAVPASTVEQANANAWPVRVKVIGGTVTVVAIGPPSGTVATGATVGSFILQPGWAIKLTYSAAPTWEWAGM